MDAKGLHDFYFDEMKWCGCGDPAGAMEFVGKVLDILKRRSDSNTSPANVHYEQSEWKKHTDELRALIGEDDVRGLIIMYVIDSFGLTEHGGNVNGSWLTPKGEEVLAAIKEHGKGDWLEPWEFAQE